MFSTVLINQALLLNFIFKILSLAALAVKCYILPLPISLLVVICFEIPITRTVFDFL